MTNPVESIINLQQDIFLPVENISLQIILRLLEEFHSMFSSLQLSCVYQMVLLSAQDYQPILIL